MLLSKEKYVHELISSWQAQNAVTFLWGILDYDSEFNPGNIWKEPFLKISSMWLQHFISSFINEESFFQALSSHQFLSKLMLSKYKNYDKWKCYFLNFKLIIESGYNILYIPHCRTTS